MKRVSCILLLIFVFIISGCSINHSDKNNIESYLQDKSVINYKNYPYYYFNDSIEYYKLDDSYVSEYEAGYKKFSYNNEGDTIIYRDYLDGVEIIEYDGWDPIVIIPEKIAGKYVIKLSGYLSDDEIEEPAYEFVSCFNAKTEITEIYIPSKVKEIVNDTFDIEYLEKIEVSEDNPYYSSKDGILYNKDGTVKLCVPNNYKSSN